MESCVLSVFRRGVCLAGDGNKKTTICNIFYLQIEKKSDIINLVKSIREKEKKDEQRYI